MRRNGGDVEGTDAEEVKGHGGRYSAARVQTLLEQNADAVYGAAAFFVTLAVLILALTPTAIEVDAGGNPVRATHLKLNLPSAFRVKLSKIAHSVKDTLSHVDWTSDSGSAPSLFIGPSASSGSADLATTNSANMPNASMRLGLELQYGGWLVDINFLIAFNSTNASKAYNCNDRAARCLPDEVCMPRCL